MIRPQPNERGAALWAALRAARSTGLTARQAEERGICSAPYGRRILRLWANAGYCSYRPPETQARDDSSHYVMLTGAPKLVPIVTLAGEVHDRAGAMSAREFAAIRRKLGLSLVQMALALGRTGMRPTLSRAMRRYEQGDSIIDEAMAERLRAVAQNPNG